VREEKEMKIELDIPENVCGRLDAIRGKTGAENVTEVIRRALAVYDALVMTASSDDARAAAVANTLLGALDVRGNQPGVVAGADLEAACGPPPGELFVPFYGVKQ
jgi:hypothetical protein